MSKPASHRPAGFSLIEIMVGLAIGMLAIIVMLQVFALSEERKRTATSGGDAQSAGVVAFYQLQRDIGQAGYGFSAVSLFNCNITWPIASGATIATAVPLAPVTINPGTAIIPAGDANTDTMLVMYGNTNGQPQGDTINSQAAAFYTMGIPSAYTAPTNGKPGDSVIAAPAACGVNLIIDRITAVAVTTVTVATGATGVTLYNLGPTPTVLAYAIRGGNLTVCDYMANDCGLAANKGNVSIWIPLATNIVSMKALYARDTSGTMDGIAETYDQTTPGSAADTSGRPANCNWARVSAVSLALVARSSQYDKAVVTSSAPSWSVAIDLTKNPDGSANANWQHYRYKLFQAIAPIRNVAWMGVPSGC